MKVKFAMKKSHLAVFEVMEPGGQYELNIIYINKAFEISISSKLKVLITCTSFSINLKEEIWKPHTFWE